MALKGVDPRQWDLRTMLAAFEATLRNNCKDEAEWNKLRAQIYAEPREERDARRAAPAESSPAGRMTVDDAEALIARMAAEEAQYA